MVNIRSKLTAIPSHSAPTCLSAKARNLINASVASKTQNRKRNNIVEFLDWAYQQRLHAKDILPASEVILCEYAAEFGGKLAGASAKAKLSAIKGWTITKGYAWQGGDRLRKVLAGVHAKGLRPQQNHLLWFKTAIPSQNQNQPTEGGKGHGPSPARVDKSHTFY
ncbi:hypothetical protein EV368DRAFT_65380 [Lentinula lateritia]|nr:hypothetical protein EV368DRAFT_65380 [Lentinula lateritia]